MSTGVTPASASARRAASAPRTDEDCPRRASRRSAMPVRWRIHSSVVSMKSERRSLVTRPSGTNMPEPRTTIWTGGTPRSYRRDPLRDRGEVDVAGDVVGRRVPAEHAHARRDVDPHAAGVLVRDTEGAEDGTDDRRLVGLEMHGERSGRPAVREEAIDRDVAGGAGVEELDEPASRRGLRQPDGEGRGPRDPAGGVERRGERSV